MTRDQLAAVVEVLGREGVTGPAMALYLSHGVAPEGVTCGACRHLATGWRQGKERVEAHRFCSRSTTLAEWPTYRQACGRFQAAGSG